MASISRLGARRQTILRCERLEPRFVMTGVVINEFLAVNDTGLRDEDGFNADWIELHNTTAAPVDLAGWHLTDEFSNLQKWTFPAITIPGGGYLLIFASGKDRAAAGAQLHTNFALDAAGEYLALVLPDGATVADAFDPFPAQLPDISYGRGGQVVISENMIGDAAPFSYLVPNSGTSATWYAGSFDDTRWAGGVGGVGFDTAPDYDSYIDVDIQGPMLNVRSSVYLRYHFPLVNPASVTSLQFRIRYDDGFALYLNGSAIPAPVGRRNAPASLAYDSAATASHPDAQAVVYEDIDLSAYQHLLVPGDNVLAIHGLNVSATNGDFLIAPLLVAERLSDPVTGYMVAPTPAAVNQEGSLGVVANTTLSVNRGFYSTSFPVIMTTATVDAQIRYTTDGNRPTASTGIVYDPLNPPLVNQTTTVRAAAFKAGYATPHVETQTYIFVDDVVSQNAAGLPPVSTWGLNGPDWEMDPAVVNNPAYATTIKDDLKAIPTVSLVMPWNDWFGGPGVGIYPTQAEIERAVSMEYITADGTNQFQIDAGVEIQGGTSDDRWKMDKLSMRVKFTAPYGPEKLGANVYNLGSRDEGAAIEFNTFVLDAHLGYTWAYGGPAGFTQRVNAMFVQDAYVADLQNLAGGAAPHSRFVHLYLNGLYWGVYDMHERADEHFAESYLGGSDDDYDVIKHRPATEVNGIDLNPDPNVYESSAIANYAAMLELSRQDMTVQANYDAVAAKLDIDDFLVYMAVNYYVGNTDWAHQNWYASFNRNDAAGRWRYHSWDAENVLKSVNENNLSLDNLGGPTEVFNRLMVSPEFRLRFNDVVQRLMANGGRLTPAGAATVYQARIDELGRALVGESARWGDSRTNATDPVGAGNPYLLSHWTTRNDSLLTGYFPQRTGIVLSQFVAKGWSTTLAAPTFTNYGGTVAVGTQVTIAKPSGVPASSVLYYTLDGSDPRAVGGAVAAAAIAAPGGSTTLTIAAGVQVRARIFNGAEAGTINDWSAEVDATFLPDTPFPLRITELHYNPAATVGVIDPQDLEFIELQNTSADSISLDDVRITEFSGTGYLFPVGLQLAGGERIVVARSPAIFTAAYGAEVRVVDVGYFDQNLSNGGERIALLGPLGEVLQDFTYDDAAGWPLAADGFGKSLEIDDPLADPSIPGNWRASFYVGGSPGSSGAPPSIAGDFTGDNIVAGDDFLVWQRGFAMLPLRGSAATGDADGDRDVDFADRTLWASNFGQVAAEANMFVAASASSAGRLQIAGEDVSIAASEQTRGAAGRWSAQLAAWPIVFEPETCEAPSRLRNSVSVQARDVAFATGSWQRKRSLPNPSLKYAPTREVQKLAPPESLANPGLESRSTIRKQPRRLSPPNDP